jgi:metacaspase-1
LPTFLNPHLSPANEQLKMSPHHHHHHHSEEDEYSDRDPSPYREQYQQQYWQGTPPDQMYQNERALSNQGMYQQPYQQGPPPNQQMYQQPYQQGPPPHQQMYQQPYQQGPPPHQQMYQPPPAQMHNPQYSQQAPQQFQMQHQQQFNPAFHGGHQALRRKSLLIGINYTGSKNQLRGCQQDVRNMTQFLISRGYPSDEKSMVILTDARQGPFYPSGRNILAAMDWLVSEPGTQCFLHYSGHGGQVPDPDGDRESGLDDTIVPVDFEQNGQITSDTLHRHLVSKLPPSSSLFIVFDCCHSGSALELPFVYRTDEDGNVNLVDSVKKGISLVMAANNLIQGGFSTDKARDAQQLVAGAKSFFKGLTHRNDQGEGLQEDDDYQEDWASEGKSVFMFSGCRDDQTSADANIAGANVGAMSWALLETMHRYSNDPNLSYVQVSFSPLANAGRSLANRFYRSYDTRGSC